MRIFFILAFLLCQPAHAGVSVGSDVFAATLLNTDVMLRTHNFAYLTFKQFGIGVVGIYERPHSYVQDIIVGPGLRFGAQAKISVDVTAGYFDRTYTMNGPGDATTTFSGKGIGGALVIAKNLNKYVRVALPVIFKRTMTQEAQDIDDGSVALPDRFEADLFPTIGLAIGI